MFLSSLKLKNVRSVAEAELSFADSSGRPRQRTLLMGENGCGKSTVIRAAAVITAGSEALPTLLTNPGALVRNGTDRAEMHATLTTAAGEHRNVSLVIEKGATIDHVLKQNDEGLRELDAAIRMSTRNYFVAGYGASRRLPNEDASAFSRRKGTSIRALAVQSLFDRSTVLEPLDQWIMDQDYRSNGEALVDVRLALDGLLPEVSFHSVDKQNARVMFKTADGLVPLSDLSDGYQNVAAWCGDLLARITRAFDDRRRPREARGLLLIDEIDLHLHPRWQRALLQYIEDQFPNLQVLATTHSPFTAQQARPGELFLMPRDAEGHVTLRPFQGDPRRLRIEQLVDPLLGIETTESQWFEEKRNELEQARANDNKPIVKALEQELGTVVRERLDDKEKDQIALLQRIQKALEAQNGGTP